MTALRPPSVIVHLTPYVSGCETAGVDAKSRNRTFWFKPLPTVLTSVLKRIGRAAGEIRVVQPEGSDEIDLMAAGPDGDLVPLACIWAGAELGQVRDAVAQLAAPSKPQPQQGVAA